MPIYNPFYFPTRPLLALFYTYPSQGIFCRGPNSECHLSVGQGQKVLAYLTHSLDHHQTASISYASTLTVPLLEKGTLSPSGFNLSARTPPPLPHSIPSKERYSTSIHPIHHHPSTASSQRVPHLSPRHLKTPGPPHPPKDPDILTKPPRLPPAHNQQSQATTIAT